MGRITARSDEGYPRVRMLSPSAGQRLPLSVGAISRQSGTGEGGLYARRL